ncbi:unnamed protein product [Durusdinium trenchii]|uniref:Uncharacterized protein n=1 Tax=Durusdinium trenchii TaxID=1381693 RepID=A0ABP0KET2_9DINO
MLDQWVVFPQLLSKRTLVPKEHVSSHLGRSRRAKILQSLSVVAVWNWDSFARSIHSTDQSKDFAGSQLPELGITGIRERAAVSGNLNGDPWESLYKGTTGDDWESLFSYIPYFW